MAKAASKLTPEQIAENKRIQQELQAAGYNLGPRGVDGIVGEDTRKAYEEMKADQRRQAVAAEQRAAAQAATDAKAREAEAEAARANAEAARATAARAAADAAREATEQQKIQQEIEARRQVFDSAVKTASIAAGLVASVKIHSHFEHRANESIVARNAQLQALAKEADNLIPKVKGVDSKAATRLTAIEGQARAAGLLGTGRGLGTFVLGGSLIAEGVIARYLASQERSPTLNTLGTAFGAASIAAGVGVIGKELATFGSPKVTFDAAAQSKIVQGAQLAAAGAPAGAAGGQTPPPAPAPVNAAGKPLSPRGKGATGPSVAELRKLAGEKGVTGASRMTKLELMGKLGMKSLSILAPVGLAAAVLGGGAGESQAAEGEAKQNPLLAGAKRDDETMGQYALRVLNNADKSVAFRAADTIAFGALSAMIAAVNYAATKAPDDTTGLSASPEIEAAMPAETPPPSIRDLARQQASERAERQAAAEVLPPAKPERPLGERIAEDTGMSAFFSAAAAPEQVARTPYMQMGADFAREAAVREPVQSPDKEPVVGVVPNTGPSAALRGWANPAVQAAAQEARRRKLG